VTTVPSENQDALFNQRITDQNCVKLGHREDVDNELVDFFPAGKSQE